MKRNKSKISCKWGFTLIELLVVVLIIGILSAVAVPQYQKAVTKSKVARAEAQLRALDIAQREYWLANGSFARDVAQLSVSFPSWGCNDSVNIESFCAIRVDKNVTLEWKGNDHMRKAIWTCIAKSTLAQAICAEYQAQWGGTDTTVMDSGNIYYYGAWK